MTTPPPDHDEANALLQLGGTLYLAEAALGAASKYFPEEDSTLLRCLFREIIALVRVTVDRRLADIKRVVAEQDDRAERN